MNHTRRTIAFVTLALAASLAACGGSDEATAPETTRAQSTTVETSTPTVSSDPESTESANTEPTETASTAPAAFAPVDIEHLYGTTSFEQAPQRIVSLDPQWTDVLTTLDAPLVGASLPLGSDEWFPWQETEGVEVIPVQSSVPFEAVAALDPDLIVASWEITDQATYDLLAAIAPTIGLLGDEQVDAWEDMTVAAGNFLGEPDLADQVISDADQRLADLSAELPGLDGKTYILANYVPGDAIYVVADPDDGASQLFAGLGMSIDPEMLQLADGAAGRVLLSLERVGELDADVLLLLTNGADPNEIPGYDALPAVQSGAVTILDLVTASAINTPSPLSIPYALDQLRPALEAAATE